MGLPAPPSGLRQVTRRPWSTGVAATDDGGGGMTSDQIRPGSCAGSESPIALTATTEIRTAFAGPLPGVETAQPTVTVQSVVDTLPPESTLTR